MSRKSGKDQYGENHYGWYSNSVAVIDIDGDGYSEVLVGAPASPQYGNTTGRVYIYSYLPPNSVKEEKEFSGDFKLYQNYPNPFNSQTVIEYELKKSGWVKLELFNILGQKIYTLIDSWIEAGKNTLSFDAGKLPSGVYYYRLISGDYVETKRLVLVR